MVKIRAVLALPALAGCTGGVAGARDVWDPCWADGELASRGASS
jgi:hypothetical protein